MASAGNFSKQIECAQMVTKVKLSPFRIVSVLSTTFLYASITGSGSSSVSVSNMPVL